MINLESVDVIDFLTALDMENVTEATATEAQFSCPFPNHDRGDENPSAYMNLDSTAWFCHSCGGKGNAVTFLAELEDITNNRAENFIRDRYDAGYKAPKGGTMVAEWNDYLDKKDEPEPEKRRPTQDDLWRFNVDWYEAQRNVNELKKYDEYDPILSYMFDRGFNPDILTAFDIGYDPLSERFTIPIFDEFGDLVGFKGRAWSEENKPKYLNMGDRKGNHYGFDPYDVGRYVFEVKDAESLIVCEGELNVVALKQAGFDNAVAIGGSNPTVRQADILKWHTDRVICFFDSDESGWKSAFRLIQLLESFIRVGFVPEHEGDPAEWLKEYGDDVVAERVDNLLKGVVSSLSL